MRPIRKVLFCRPVFSRYGDVAQLGERGVRNAEVRGSIPLISTNVSLAFKNLRKNVESPVQVFEFTLAE